MVKADWDPLCTLPMLEIESTYVPPIVLSTHIQYYRYCSILSYMSHHLSTQKFKNSVLKVDSTLFRSPNAVSVS
jgi:hypothetical protein